MTDKKKTSARFTPGKRGTVWMVDPRTLTLIFDDTHPAFDESRMIADVDVLDPTHHLFDERAMTIKISPELCRNMSKHGVLKNIVAERMKIDGTERLVVVDGRNRTLHARVTADGLEAEGNPPLLVPVTIRRGDQGAMVGAMLAGNSGTVAETPMQQARKIQRYLALGYSNADAADTYAVTTATIRNRLKLLELSPKVQKAIDQGLLTPTEAIQWGKDHKGDHEKQDQLLKAHLEAEGKRLSSEGKGGKKGGRKKRRHSPKRATIRQLIDLMPVNQKARVVLEWAIGEITNDDAASKVKELADLLG